MRRFFKRHTKNPWLDKDRHDQRRIIVTAVLFALALLGGIGWLIYALVSH